MSPQTIWYQKEKRKYYELYKHNFDKTDEMDKFFAKYKLLQLTQYEIDD